jgi:hypothetical protein
LTPWRSFRTASCSNTLGTVSVPLHHVGLYILYAESISPCVSATANTLQSQAAVRAKSYCVALHDGAKSYCVTLHDGHNDSPASALANIISGTRKIWSPYSSDSEALYTCISVTLTVPRVTLRHGVKFASAQLLISANQGSPFY